METYQSLLREEFVKRRKRNPDYSLRAFAKQLGITPGGLSKILNGKMGLSTNRAHELATKLRLSETETETFLNLVQLAKADSVEIKERILKKMEQNEGTPFHDLGVDHFKMISEWYPMAILKVVSVPQMKRTVPAMAKLLGISTAEVKQAVERLQRLELVDEESAGSYRRVPEAEVHVHVKTQSDAARKYYGEVLTLLRKNIEEELPETRAIASNVLVLDRSQLKRVEALTLEYHQKLNDLSNRSKQKEIVCQVLSTVFEIKK